MNIILDDISDEDFIEKNLLINPNDVDTVYGTEQSTNLRTNSTYGFGKK